MPGASRRHEFAQMSHAGRPPVTRRCEHRRVGVFGEWGPRMHATSSGTRLYRLARNVLAPALRAAYDIDIEGRSHIPAVGPVVLAPNHRSFMDSLFVPAAVPRPVSFLAKAEYFDKRTTAWMFRATGQIPVRRGSPAGARQALAAAREVLDGGGIVGIYPEGTRSRDGLLHRGNLGPARLAFATNTPIIPVGLIGTAEVQAPDKRLPRVGQPVAVRFGAPIWPDLGVANQRVYLRELTEELMHRIASLCEQEYVSRSTLEKCAAASSS